jgi:hypothetical protein
MREKPSPSLPAPASDSIDLPRLVIKTVCLFILFNLVFALVKPLPVLGSLSAYNVLFPGRLRLPYGEDPSQSYNLSLFNLDAMFASHAVAAAKAANEYRVVLIGDSSTWGYYLKPDQTSSAYLNQANLTWPDGRKMRFYNLGYPTLSLAKDVLILNYALRYQPDMIIWVVTLESFSKDNQLNSPIVQHNPVEMQAVIQSYGLNLDPHDPGFVWPGFWQSTLIGQRRDLADVLRLQLYGVLWAATGIDQYYPPTITPVQVDLPDDQTFHKLNPPTLKPEDISLDILQAGMQAAGNIPVLLVNEPIFLSPGKNSNIRYNFFYPRWAYNQYRVLLSTLSQAHGWHYLDLWNLLPAKEFTNSAIHVTPLGESGIAQKIKEAIGRLFQ